MSWALLLDIVAALFFTSLVVYVNRRRPPAPLWPILLWVLVFPLVWIFGDIINLTVPEGSWADVSTPLIYAGSLPLPAAWWLMAFRFAETHGVRFRWAKRWVQLAPFAWSAVTWLLIASNPWHGLMLEEVPGSRNVHLDLWWATVPLGYAVMVGCIGVLAAVCTSPSITPHGRRQSILLMAAASTGPIGNAFYVMLPTPPPLDVTVFAAILAGTLFVVGIYRGQLFDLSPLASREVLRRQPTGLLILGPDGRIKWSNDQARDLLGGRPLSREVPVAAILRERLELAEEDTQPSDLARVIDRLVETEFQGALFLQVRWGETDAENRIRWLWIYSERVRRRILASPHLIHIHDVTPLKVAEMARVQMERHLRRSERIHSLGILATGMAHEINNPVGAILLAAQMAQEVRADSPRGPRAEQITGEALATIVTHAEQASRILAGVLRLSREDGSRPVPCDINVVVQNALELSSELLRRKSVKLEVELAPGLPKVSGRATELEQVVMNLIDNGARSGPDGRRLQVRTEAKGGRVHLIVSDDGAGMTPEAVERAFEPFFTHRLDGSSGTGLGLSVVHGIVTEHGGMVRLESSPGLGTTVDVELPAIHTAH